METIFLRSRVEAPIAVVWRSLLTLCSTGIGSSVTTEVLGGQPPTLLSFRLLSGAPVRRNVLAVQLCASAADRTELFVDGAFQPSLAGRGGLGRRQMRRVLVELTERLEDVARSSSEPGLLPIPVGPARP